VKTRGPRFLTYQHIDRLLREPRKDVVLGIYEYAKLQNIETRTVTRPDNLRILGGEVLYNLIGLGELPTDEPVVRVLGNEYRDGYCVVWLANRHEHLKHTKRPVDVDALDYVYDGPEATEFLELVGSWHVQQEAEFRMLRRQMVRVHKVVVLRHSDYEFLMDYLERYDIAEVEDDADMLEERLERILTTLDTTGYLKGCTTRTVSFPVADFLALAGLVECAVVQLPADRSGTHPFERILKSLEVATDKIL